MKEDTNSIYYNTKLNNAGFPEFASSLKNLESLEEDCYNHMSVECANVMSKQIHVFVQSFKRSIDGTCLGHA